MGETEVRRGQKWVLSRLRAMGIPCQPLPGDRCVVGELRLRPAPFPGLAGPLLPERLRFATVGAQHVKCVAPRPFFYLPLVCIAGCADAGAVEDRIRAAWAAHGEGLRRARARLGALGAAPEVEAGGTVLAVPLGLEDDASRLRVLGPERAVLPGRGPLAGLPLPRADLRLHRPDADAGSATELEIATTTALETLARERRHEAARRRTERAHRAPAEERQSPRARPPRLQHRVLLVGPLLARDAALRDGLRREGYAVATARGAAEAFEAFADRSFDVVFTDAELGRAEGLELIPALEALPGVVRLPVVLVDERLRPARREAARRVGAAGYLVHPVRIARVARGLSHMAQGERGRRFLRFGPRLAVRLEGADEPGFTTTVSRLGMFVRTERPSGRCDLERCELVLPETGARLRVEAQTLYRVEMGAARTVGLGLRFRSFPDGNESSWIDYLRALAGAEPRAA